MKLTDQQLSALVARLEREPESAPPSVDPEFIARAAEGRLSEEEKATLPALLAANPTLRAELQLAIGLRRDLKSDAPPAGPSRTRLAAGVWPIAAALVIGAGIITWLASSRLDVGPESALRAPAGQTQPANGAVLSQAPDLMTWEPRSLRNRYRVEILSGNGELVWRSDWINGNQVRYSGPALASGSYRWRAVAFDDTDPQLAPTNDFTVE